MTLLDNIQRIASYTRKVWKARKDSQFQFRWKWWIWCVANRHLIFFSTWIRFNQSLEISWTQAYRTNWLNYRICKLEYKIIMPRCIVFYGWNVLGREIGMPGCYKPYNSPWSKVQKFYLAIKLIGVLFRKADITNLSHLKWSLTTFIPKHTTLNYSAYLP